MYNYHPQTKLQEGNVFIHVCLFKGTFMRALPMMLWASPYRDPPALALAPDLPPLTPDMGLT